MKIKHNLSQQMGMVFILLIIAMAFAAVFAPAIAYAAPQYASSYNGQKAATWALNNVYSPSAPGYFDYSGKGGDCTNFVSHAIYQGGLPMVGLGTNSTSLNVWWQRDLSWWDANILRKDRNSYTWTFADKFGTFLTSSGKATISGVFYKISMNTSSFKVGDIVQMSTSKSVGNAHHSMIVTYASAGVVKVTYRNSSGNAVQKDRNLQEMMNYCWLNSKSGCANDYFILIKIK